MVFFTCAGCNESLKKNQVQNHRFRCSRSHTVSCVDCQKDFHGRDFEVHTKCISEDQKYGGANYVAKPNKGEVKQQRWFETVQQAIDQVASSHNRQLQQLLEKIKPFPNIPQKEKAFINFVGNSCRERNVHLVSQAWAALSKAAVEIKKNEEKQKEEQVSNGADKVAAENGSQIIDDSNTVAEQSNKKKRRKSVEDSSPKDEKKRKVSEQDQTTILNLVKEEIEETPSIRVDKKSIKSLVKLFLKEAENQELKLKRLKKMIAMEIQVEDEEQKLELGAKIDEYLKKHNTKYATDGKIVRLAVEA